MGEVSWAELPAFRDSNEGYLLRVDNAPEPSLPKRVHSLSRTTDGGKTWSRHTGLPQRTSAFILLPGEDMLFTTFDGKVYVSHDNGKTAVLERDSSDLVW